MPLASVGYNSIPYFMDLCIGTTFDYAFEFDCRPSDAGMVTLANKLGAQLVNGFDLPGLSFDRMIRRFEVQVDGEIYNFEAVSN